MSHWLPGVNRKGFTVVEILVACVILLVMTAVMFQLLVPSMAMFKSQMAYSQAHQSSLMAAQKIKRELTNSAVSTLTISPETFAFSFTPKDQAAPFTSSGETRFAQIFIVYFLEEDKLIRKFWPYGDDEPPADLFGGSLPPRLTLEQLRAATVTKNGTERVLASRVSHWLVGDAGTDGVLLEPPIVVEITCSVPINSEEVEEYEVRMEVTPRTQGW